MQENLPLLAFSIVFFTIIVFVILDFKYVKYAFYKLTDWIKDNPEKAIFVVIVIYALLIVFMGPIAHMHLIVGYTYSEVFKSTTYGFFVGMPIAFSGAMFGAALSFILSRYLMKDYVKTRIFLYRDNPWLTNIEVIDQLFQDPNQSLKVIALMRLIMIPFGLTNYLLGVTSVSFWRYMLGSSAYIFKCSLHTYIGCTLYMVQFLKAKDKSTENTIFMVEIIFTVILTLVVSTCAKNLLNDRL